MATTTETAAQGTLENLLLKNKGYDASKFPAVSHRPITDGVKRIKASTEGAVEKIIAAFKEDGAVIIDELVPRETIDRLNTEIDPLIEKFEFGCPEDAQNEAVKAFHGVKSKRMTNLTTRCKTWREEICDLDIVHDITKRTFQEESGDYWQGTAQVIELGPGAPCQMLHRDGGNMPVFWKMGTDGLEVVNNFLIACTETTVENGATHCIPGSHKWDLLDLAGGDLSLAVRATLKPGDALYIGGKILHAGGANKTDKARRVISWNFCPSYIVPEEACPMLVPRDIARTLSPRMQRCLGFRSLRPKGAQGIWMSDMNELGKELGMM